MVADALGPFDTPFQPAAVTSAIRHAFGPQPSPPALGRLEAARQGDSYLMATQTSALAAPYIFASGLEVLPLGGWTGTVPEPSPGSLAALLSSGRFHVALIASPGATSSTSWIAGHCLRVGQPAGTSPTALVPHIAVYYCSPSGATRPPR